MPVLEVKARRVGGATYQVPMEVRPERRADPGPALADHLFPCPQRAHHAVSVWPARSWTPSTAPAAPCKKREDTHKMAEANKAFRSLQILICVLTFRRKLCQETFLWK